MFVRQAHSFGQQARLALTLAWVSGCANIVAVFSCGHVISHVSGTTSDLGRLVVEQQWRMAGFALYLLLTFVTGAVISGLSTEFGRHRKWASIYVLPMAIEMVLLGIFAIGVSQLDGNQILDRFTLYSLTGIASMSMGLQNATITRISSGVVRTTHVTGVLTDLGLEAAQLAVWSGTKLKPTRSVPATWWRDIRAHPASRRIALLAGIMVSFALGAALGALLHSFETTRPWAMFPPVLFLAFSVYQDVRHPIAEIAPSDLIGDIALDLPEGLAVFHLKRDTLRNGPQHRMPNLLAWSENLPAEARVIILDIDLVKELDIDAAFELRALLTNLERQGRRLVISGVSRSQFEQLRKASIDQLLDPESVCPDLEFAIARGMNLLNSD